MLKNILSIFFIIAAGFVNAQNAIQSEEHELTTVLNPWLLTDNAAGLGLSTVKLHGISELGYKVSMGDLHRTQEGNEISGLDFYSERYDKLSKNWNSWGSFNFIMDREKNRAWSDVIRTYNNNPYIFGSSIPGNYDRQLFDFHVKTSSKNFGRFTYGIGIDYQVGDLSRLRDPRTRVYLADYAILPGLTFRISDKNFLGLNFSARYQKEKMPNITTVQDDPNLRYYTFFGMENANAVIGGYKGFQRQFVSELYDVNLQYAYASDKSRFLISGGISTQNQQILENIKQSPGTFNVVIYKTLLNFSTNLNNILLNATADALIKYGSADENLQELTSVNDSTTGVNSQTWVTLFTYKNQYISNSYKAKLKIDVRELNKNRDDFKWMGGIEAGTEGFTNQYNLPYSAMNINRLNAGIYGHFRLLKVKQKRLTLKANLSYETSFNNTLELRDGVTTTPVVGSGAFTQGTYDVATNILIPDFNFYSTNLFKYRIETKYSIPFNLKKAGMIGYVRLYYGQTKSDNMGSWTNTGISIGILQ